MEKERLDEWFLQRLSGTITPEEERAFRLFVSDTANQELVESYIANILEQSPDLDLPSPEAEKALLDRILSNASAGTRSGNVRTLWRWGWAAAAIILFAAGGLYLWMNRDEKVRSNVMAKQEQKADIEAGKDGAILTLADGRQVVLDSLGNGIVATQNGINLQLNNGRLAYEAVVGGRSVRARPLPSQRGTAVYNVLTTPKGRQFRLVLPDGSKVWLNAASSIKYPVVFDEEERRVEISGEVYLEVAHSTSSEGENIAFIVQTANQQIRVLGTSFNVNAYDDEGAEKTTLIEGSVRVTAGGDSSWGTSAGANPGVRRKFVILKPGQQASVLFHQFQKFPPIQVQAVDVDRVIAWKNGFFQYNNADIETIMRQVERWYDVKVSYPNGIPADRFSGTIPMHVSLSHFLDILKYSDIKASINGNNLIISP
mgnify:CR=1 FL=1